MPRQPEIRSGGNTLIFSSDVTLSIAHQKFCIRCQVDLLNIQGLPRLNFTENDDRRYG